jgi:hypothetical protein
VPWDLQKKARARRAFLLQVTEVELRRDYCLDGYASVCAKLTERRLAHLPDAFNSRNNRAAPFIAANRRRLAQ